MNTRLFFFLCILFFSIDSFSQSSKQLIPVVQYATAYIVQPSSTKQPSIRMVYETGETEIILLEKYSSSEERKAGGKTIAATDLDNQILITGFINNLAKKQYTLKEIEYEVSSHSTKYTVFLFETIAMVPLEEVSQK